MDFDAYWSNLVQRIYQENEPLNGPEEVVYRLTCIYGETMVDGVEAYFERRFREYNADKALLIELGFTDIANDFEQARIVMFGNRPLDDDTVNAVMDRLYDEDESLEGEWEELPIIYARLTERLPKVLKRRDEIGIANGLFTPDAAGKT